MNMKSRTVQYLLSTRMVLVLLISLFPLFTALPAVAQPRALPQKQAARFCRLLVNDGEGKIYPLSVYARRLTMLLCHDSHYGRYTAEQVFTGLIFFYDEWAKERLPYSNGQGRMLMEELHSGQTLRLFPHAGTKRVVWYAPTDPLPASVAAEHQKYIREAFSRLNALVQAGDWKSVEAFVERMIRYQCEFATL